MKRRTSHQSFFRRMSPAGRLGLLILAIVALMVVSALIYREGMIRLEEEPRSFFDSLQWAAETITTTGYGSDGRWENPAMALFVIALELIGVFIIFLVVPVYLIPFLEERFEARLPRTATNLTDHVVVYRFGPPVKSLLDELDAARVDSLVVENDESKARRLLDRGQRVIVGRLEDDVLEAASLGSARALIANGNDAENATVALAARQLGFTGKVLALVEEPFHRRPIQLAGADGVFTPRHMLGAALAARASHRVSPRLSGIRQLGRHLHVGELKMARRSALAGKTLADAEIGSRTGAVVIGIWIEGRLEPADSETRMPAQSILVAAGSEESLERLEELVSSVGEPRDGPVVVAGYGEVGQKVVELLHDAGEQTWTVDRDEKEGVDQVGDCLDPRVLEAAGAARARAVVLALNNDDATLFGAVILKDTAPGTPVIARVNNAENVGNIYRAGADFALSISQVSGQILAYQLLGLETVAVVSKLKLRRVAAAAVGDRRLADLDLRNRFGCSVVAVERNEELLVEIRPDFRFEAGDAIYVSGEANAVDRLPEELG